MLSKMKQLKIEYLLIMNLDDIRAQVNFLTKI